MKTTEQIMESIQEHASTWSLAGGRFDDGTMFEQAKQQKAALRTAIEELHRDAARYRAVRRGQKWSVIDGIGDTLRADDLDAAIDAAMKKPVVKHWHGLAAKMIVKLCRT